MNEDTEARFEFKRIAEDGSVTIKISHRVCLVEDDGMGILMDFEDFLRGCGYFFHGNIEIVEDEG